MKTLNNLYGLRFVSCLAITATHLWASLSVQAQLIPDNTLGAEPSIVTPQSMRDLIEGGARQGSNLFHSFMEFNVGNQQQVYFANPTGVTNILTRITGHHSSNILGTLGVDGAANLFLINPNGIIFGSNARLDVAGSFVASTADGIKLGDDGLFHAKEPEQSTLLSIQPGVLFSNALHSHQAEIRNQGNLAVGFGQTLALQGDIVTNMGFLTAPGGTVQVLGTQVNLLNNANIDVSALTGGGTVFIGNGKLINVGARVRIHADALNNGNGGTVIVQSDDSTRFKGRISARGGGYSGNGGFVDVSGGNLQFAGRVDTSAPHGQMGTLLLDPKDILIQRGGTISGQQLGQALLTNDVILQANNDITVNDNITGIRANSLSLQAGRSIVIAPNRSILLNGGDFSATINDQNAIIPAERDAGIAQFVMSPGSQILTNGGNVTITSGTFEQTSQIDTTNGGIITSNLAGHSGNITLFALGDITTGLLDTRSETGNGGNISVTSAGGSNCIDSSACAIATTNSIFADSLFQAGDISLNAAGNLSMTVDKFDLNGNITSNGAVPGKVTLTSGGILLGQGVVLANTIFGSSPPSGITNAIALTAPSIVLEDSIVTANTFSNAQGGELLLNATDEVVLRNSALGTAADSLSNLKASGNAGNVTLNTRRLTIIQDPGTTFPFLVGVGSIGRANSGGNTGDVTINARESVEIVGNQPGAFTITPNQQAQTILQLDTGISTSAFGTGNSGKLTVNTGRLVVRDGGGITTFPTLGRGGDLTVNATEIVLQGQGGIGTTATSRSQDAGDLTLNAERVTIADGAAIATATFGEGNSGDLTLSVRQLSILNGSAIVTTTLAEGDGGTLTIKDSELIEVIGTSPDGSFVSTIGANSLESGQAAKLDIDTEQLIVRRGGQITVSALGTSNAGDIEINARSILLDNAYIGASSTSGEGGNINLRVTDNTILRNGSQISTQAGSQPSDRGNGGNMDIDAQLIVAIPQENSDIIANAFAGQGGTINITAQGIFGLQVNNTKQPLPTSEISASSRLGIDGRVNINTPDVDPSRGLTELPSNFTNPSDQIVAGCPADKGNNFVVTGRGGIPDNPSQYLRGRAVWQDTRNLPAANRPSQPTISTKLGEGDVQASAPIVPPQEAIARSAAPRAIASLNKTNNPPLIEAQGWMVNDSGAVILTAESNGGRLPGALVSAQSCEEIPKEESSDGTLGEKN